MKNLLTSFLLFLSVQIFAQSKENQRVAFGFFLSAEAQTLKMENLSRRFPEEPLVRRTGRTPTGATAGVFVRKQVWPWLDFQPTLSLFNATQKVTFLPGNEEWQEREYRFWDLEMPIHFIISDRRRDDSPLRSCIILGGRIGWNLAKNQHEQLKIAQERFALDLGIGADIKLGKGWILQPAIVYSHGLNELHLVSQTKYDWVVGSIMRDKLAMLRISVWRQRK
jgi:hypothetical protein